MGCSWAAASGVASGVQRRGILCRHVHSLFQLPCTCYVDIFVINKVTVSMKFFARCFSISIIIKLMLRTEVHFTVQRVSHCCHVLVNCCSQTTTFVQQYLSGYCSVQAIACISNDVLVRLRRPYVKIPHTGKTLQFIFHTFLVSASVIQKSKQRPNSTF